jgi:hypothetical protein
MPHGRHSVSARSLHAAALNFPGGHFFVHAWHADGFPAEFTFDIQNILRSRK